jgi:hypothetical protein
MRDKHLNKFNIISSRGETMPDDFQVNSDPELREKLGMDVIRFSGMPTMLNLPLTQDTGEIDL